VEGSDLPGAVQVENDVARIGKVLMPAEARRPDADSSGDAPEFFVERVRSDPNHRRRSARRTERVARVGDRPDERDIGDRRPGGECSLDGCFERARAVIRVDEIANLREVARAVDAFGGGARGGAVGNVAPGDDRAAPRIRIIAPFRSEAVADGVVSKGAGGGRKHGGGERQVTE